MFLVGSFLGQLLSSNLFMFCCYYPLSFYCKEYIFESPCRTSLEVGNFRGNFRVWSHIDSSSSRFLYIDHAFHLWFFNPLANTSFSYCSEKYGIGRLICQRHGYILFSVGLINSIAYIWSIVLKSLSLFFLVSLNFH